VSTASPLEMYVRRWSRAVPAMMRRLGRYAPGTDIAIAHEQSEHLGWPSSVQWQVQDLFPVHVLSLEPLEQEIEQYATRMAPRCEVRGSLGASRAKRRGGRGLAAVDSARTGGTNAQETQTAMINLRISIPVT